jgi:translocation protein SEC62
MVGVLLAVLLPVWPEELKSILLYINIALLYILFGIMFLRVILYAVIKMFGYEFWLFPNYLEDVKLYALKFIKLG